MYSVKVVEKFQVVFIVIKKKFLYWVFLLIIVFVNFCSAFFLGLEYNLKMNLTLICGYSFYLFDSIKYKNQ